MQTREIVAKFIHPEDERARRHLETIPGFSSVVKTFLKIGAERMMHGLSMASKIRLGPNQLPDLYGRLEPICRRMGIAVPEFYLEMNPVPNAYTMGDTRLFIAVTSGLIEYMETDELDAVLAHECGHIACRHVLYHTMAGLLLQGSKASGLTSALTTPMKYALLYWQRRSELSADRAAAAALGSSAPVIETMIRLSGGPKAITEAVNVDAYAEQANAYDALFESTWDSLLQSLLVMNLTHPFAAVRVREIKHWAGGDAFAALANALQQNERLLFCSSCGGSTASNWRFCEHCGVRLN